MSQVPTQYQDQLYVPPKREIPPQDQKEEDKPETEQGEDEKTQWPTP